MRVEFDELVPVSNNKKRRSILRPKIKETILYDLESLLGSVNKSLLRSVLLGRIRSLLYHEVAPQFWDHFNDYDNIKGSSLRKHTLWINSQVNAAIEFVYTVSNMVQRSIAILYQENQVDYLSLKAGFQQITSSMLFNDKAINLQPLLRDFFSALFLVHLHQWKKNAKNLCIEDLIDCDENVILDRQIDIVRILSEENKDIGNSTAILGKQLEYLGWFGLVEEAFTEAIYSEIESKICQACSNKFGISVLHHLIQYYNEAVLPWMNELLVQNDKSLLRYNQWETRLRFHIYEAFGSLRINELFAIIKEYPDSSNALLDLKICLERTLQQKKLISVLNIAFKKRLLQPGVKTSQIIDIYILTIKALRVLDPTGVLLEGVSEAIKEYLRERRDTVRCIVTGLTDDKGSELFEELERGDPCLIQHYHLNDFDDTIQPEKWKPDSKQADPSKAAKSRSSSDLLSILVSIYGSKEVFVSEYRMMLAEKLILNLEYNTDREVCTHELLKLRFGEKSLQQCEIMIKDVDDSKRINNNVAPSENNRKCNENAAQGIVDALVVSQHFWPPFQGEEFKMHPIVEGMVQRFKEAYSALKNPRSLKWVNFLGAVELNLEVAGVQRSFTASPLHATVIMHFQEKDECSLAYLSDVMEIDEDILEKKLVFWISNRVLERSKCGNLFSIVDTLEMNTSSEVPFNEEDIETSVSLDAHRAQELQIVESYVFGMLANYGTLSIDRIHSMLSTFSRSGSESYDRTVPELSALLGKLVNEEKLEYVAGLYQIHSDKSSSL